MDKMTAPTSVKRHADLPEASFDIVDESEIEESPDKSGGLHCRRCLVKITSPAAAIEKNGAHAQTFANPAGIVFQLRCFSEAPGCRAEGFESEEFTWFAGYSWRVALCAQCREQLGWYYRSAQDNFWGLIEGKLVEGM